VSKSPEKRTFKECNLRENTDPERQYLFDIRKVGSPDKIAREAKSAKSQLGSAIAKS
jgi:hypothetical protein